MKYKTIFISESLKHSEKLSDLLINEFPECVSASKDDEIITSLQTSEPLILVFNLGSVDSAKEFYIQLFRTKRSLTKTDHKTIILCENKEAEKAYNLCKTNIFDDFVTIRSDNDFFRLRMSILQAMTIISLEHDSSLSSDISEQCLNSINQNKINSKNIIKSTDELKTQIIDEHNQLSEVILKKISAPDSNKTNNDTNKFIKNKIKDSADKISGHINKSKKIYFNEYQRLHAEAELTQEKFNSPLRKRIISRHLDKQNNTIKKNLARKTGLLC